MITGRLAVTQEEINTVKKAMKLYGASSALCMVGYWDKDKCVGGSYLLLEYPNELVMEFYTHCPTVIHAIGYSFTEFLKLKSQLNARIATDNYKSLKIARMLGFKKLYTADDKVAVQLHRKNWRYEKRHPLG